MYQYFSTFQLGCVCFSFFLIYEYMRHNVWGARVTGWDLAVTAEGVISLPSMALIGVESVLLLQYLEVVMSDLLSLPATFLPSLSTAVPEGKGRVYIVTLGSKIKELPLQTQGLRANHLLPPSPEAGALTDLDSNINTGRCIVHPSTFSFKIFDLDIRLT